MHREAAAQHDPFRVEVPWGLYLLTGVVTALLVADLWPWLAEQLTSWGVDSYSWPRTIGGVRWALLAALIGGGRILYLSLETLLRGRLGVDLALAIAVLAALALGEVLVAAEVTVIGLIGECLEAWVFGRTQQALSQLAELFPRRCWVLRDGQEVRTPVADVQVGDLVVVKPGGRVPVDGVVVAGRAVLDVSALTGESVPVEKQEGEKVLAGSIVCDAPVTIQAQQTGPNTVAGRLIELTVQALRDKAPLERQADRWARYFLPVVTALAFLTFVANLFLQRWSAPSAPDLPPPTWRAAAISALYPALGVLVVACPCALVLATPAAIIAALGRLAGSGVLLKGGSTLERLAAAQVWACDKTGTLTEGRLEVVHVQPLMAGVSEEDLLRQAAQAEQGSEHPLAQAVLRAAQQRGWQLEPVVHTQTQAGAGVVATTINGTRLAVGNLRFLTTLGWMADEHVEQALHQADERGQIAVLVAQDQHIVGLIGLQDRLRPEAAGVLAELRELGFSPLALLTGDRRAVAQAVATELPLTEVHAEMLPSDKAAWVADHADRGVVFLGDGINDAPALARASVGIAVGSGTDLAAQAGDIVLMGEPLRPLPFLVRLARQTVRVIRQNILVFAFGVNLVGILLTGWLWPLLAPNPEALLHAPLFGAIYHQIGSLLVLLNAMRLLAFERPATTAWGRFLHRWKTWERRWQHWSVEELLHTAAHHWRLVLLGAGLLSIGAWIGSTCTVIARDEVGIVMRWGRPVAELTPGLHLRWPWPIETVLRLQPERTRTVTLGFRQLASRTPFTPQTDPAFTWASAHGGPIVPRTDEALMLTADGELIEVFATLRYHVSHPHRFLFELASAENLLRGELETLLRELFTLRSFQEILTIRRSEIESEALERLRRRLAQLDADSFGIAVEGLTLHDLHPPPEVVPAYHAVARAIQERDRLINEARTEALRITRRAGENAERLLRQAEAEAAAQRLAAQADHDAFLAWVRVRQTLSPEQQEQLAQERQRRLQQGESASDVDAQLERQRQQLLAQRRFLIETRLALWAVADALRLRDKILIDSELPVGKRQLFLLDPEMLRLPTSPSSSATSTSPPP